jgi:hypothetical protein
MSTVNACADGGSRRHVNRLYRISRVWFQPPRQDLVWKSLASDKVREIPITLGSRVEVRCRDGSAIRAVLAMQPIAPRGETEWAFILTRPDERVGCVSSGSEDAPK